MLLSNYSLNHFITVQYRLDSAILRESIASEVPTFIQATLLFIYVAFPSREKGIWIRPFMHYLRDLLFFAFLHNISYVSWLIATFAPTISRILGEALAKFYCHTFTLLVLD